MISKKNPYTNIPLSNSSILVLQNKLKDFENQGKSLELPDIKSIHTKIKRKHIKKVGQIDNLLSKLDLYGLNNENISKLKTLTGDALINYIAKTTFL